MKIDEQVRRMRPPRYTVAQAAPLVGKDVDTLRRWRREGIYAPSQSRWFGALEVPLYTYEDITAMRTVAKTLKPGRKSHGLGRAVARLRSRPRPRRR